MMRVEINMMRVEINAKRVEINAKRTEINAEGTEINAKRVEINMMRVVTDTPSSLILAEEMITTAMLKLGIVPKFKRDATLETLTDSIRPVIAAA
jgi:hypothetical protein